MIHFIPFDVVEQYVVIMVALALAVGIYLNAKDWFKHE